MLIHKPESISAEKLSEGVNPKYIYGYKGWLFLISGIFLLITFYRVKFTISNTEYVYNYFSSSEKYIFWLWLAVGILNALLPFFISFLLYFKRIYSILIAKICLLLLPAAAFASLLFENPYEPDYAASFQTGFLSSFVLFTLPVFLYLHYSRRVKNTFLFYSNKLPEKLVCPFCLAAVYPDENERRSKEVLCSSCNNLINKSSVSG